jgi:hypothetical protein
MRSTSGTKLGGMLRKDKRKQKIENVLCTRS